MADRIETDFGTAILSDLIGVPLKRNSQPVRLFDQTRRTSESYFRADNAGKPYVQNWQSGKRWYPITAYREWYGVDYATAIKDLSQQYGLSNERATVAKRTSVDRPMPPPVVADYIPHDLYDPCRVGYEKNGLFRYLSSYLGEEDAQRIFERYRLGTSRHWRFAETFTTTLPQFDMAGNLRQVKIIPFHPITGKRAKDDQPAERWDQRAGCYNPESESKVWFLGKSILKSKTANLVQCYFGEHLLALFPNSLVAIVEGESTALVMSVVWPEYIWLATGGATGGSWNALDRIKVLGGRKVTLFPDSGKWQEWSDKAKDLHEIAAELIVSRHVEDNAPGPNFDLRDLLPPAPARQNNTWIRDGQTIIGEPLPELASTTDYPAEWDEPNAPDAVPEIRMLSVEEYTGRTETPLQGTITEEEQNSTPTWDEPTHPDVGQMVKGLPTTRPHRQHIFWQSWPAPPLCWNKIAAHKFLLANVIPPDGTETPLQDPIIEEEHDLPPAPPFSPPLLTGRETFHQWQQRHGYFGGHGVASLASQGA